MDQPNNPCSSHWQLDQYMLQQPDASELEAHTASCGECAQWVAQKQEDAEELRQTEGFASFLEWAQQQEERLEANEPESQPAPSLPQRSLWQLLVGDRFVGGLSLTGALAMGLLLFSFAPEEQAIQWPTVTPVRSPFQAAHTHKPTRRLPPIKRAKDGTPVFGLVHFRKGSKHSRWVKPDESLYPGDLIQFAYQMPSSRHIMVVGLNKKGQVYTFYPLGGKHSTLLHAGNGTLPPGQSLELDDYIGPELVLVFTADRPFGLSQLRPAIRKAFQQTGGSLRALKALTGPWQVQRFLYKKMHKPPQARGER